MHLRVLMDELLSAEHCHSIHRYKDPRAIELEQTEIIEILNKPLFYVALYMDLNMDKKYNI